MSTGAVQRILDRIQDSGGRITLPTRLVVTILSETDRHLTADDLIASLEERAPGVAPSTVYRVLQRLDELGLVEHVHSGAGPAFYHLHEHSHAHVMCTGCGGVTDVVGAAVDALRELRTAVRSSVGFDLDPHHAALLGRCRNCAEKPRTSVTDLVRGDELNAVHPAMSTTVP